MHPFGLCYESGKSTLLKTVVDSRERRQKKELDREKPRWGGAKCIDSWGAHL